MLSSYGMAWAALAHEGPDLLALPWTQALVGCGVAWLGGYPAYLGRKLTAIYADKPFHAMAELIRDSAVSIVIGLAGYWGGMSQGMNPALMALVLLLAGYAGTRTLATWVDRVIKPKE
jgi:hypothetical protein